MPALSTVPAEQQPPSTAPLTPDLARRLLKLQRVFDLPALRAEPWAASDVVAYLKNCHDGFRKCHSRAGAVHMALNDGGRLTLFDGYLPQRPHALAPSGAPVVERVVKGMALDRLQALDCAGAAQLPAHRLAQGALNP